MYTHDEVRKSIENESLSIALSKLEKFARHENLLALVGWCEAELHGYRAEGDASDDFKMAQAKKYRMVSLEYTDVYGRAVAVSSELSFIQKAPIWLGVSELEQFLETGCVYAIPDATKMLNKITGVNVGHPRIAGKTLTALFNRIRLEARSHFDNHIISRPRNVSGASISEQTGSSSLSKAVTWIGAIVSFTILVLSVVWLFSSFDFEPAIVAIGSLAAFLTLVLNKGRIGLVFLGGFLAGIVLIASVFFYVRHLNSVKNAPLAEKELVDTQTASVLKPTWIYEKAPILAIDNQIMIKVSQVSSELHCAVIDLDIPDQNQIPLGLKCAGSRELFSYKQTSYYLSVLEVSGTSAKISIDKKL